MKEIYLINNYSQGKNGNDCENDYIKLKENGTVIGRYCGAQSPTVSSTSNELMVIFKSDDRFRYKGFKCRYRAIQPNGNAVIGSFGDEDEDSGIRIILQKMSDLILRFSDLKTQFSVKNDLSG